MSKYAIKVTNVHCFAASKWDQATPSDEVYIIASAEDCNSHIQGWYSRVYNDVRTGQDWEVVDDGKQVVDGEQRSGTNEIYVGEIPLNKFDHRLLTVNIKMFEEDNGNLISNMSNYFNEQIKKTEKMENDLGGNPLRDGNFLNKSNGTYNDTSGPRDGRTSSGELEIWKKVTSFFAEDVLGLDDDYISQATFIVAAVDEEKRSVAIIDTKKMDIVNWYDFGAPICLSIDGGDEGSYDVSVKFVCYQSDIDDAKALAAKQQKVIDELAKLGQDRGAEDPVFTRNPDNFYAYARYLAHADLKTPNLDHLLDTALFTLHFKE